MRTCCQCEIPIPVEVDDVYCSTQCFDEAIDAAIRADIAATAEKPILLTKVKQKGCKIRGTICNLRDDAEKRVQNIESFGPDKLLKTKEYFQARADVLNDLLMIMAPSDVACSCC
jgi:hypothetical protein